MVQKPSDTTDPGLKSFHSSIEWANHGCIECTVSHKPVNLLELLGECK